jgi:hypothetical protein
MGFLEASALLEWIYIIMETSRTPTNSTQGAFLSKVTLLSTTLLALGLLASFATTATAQEEHIPFYLRDDASECCVFAQAPTGATMCACAYPGEIRSYPGFGLLACLAEINGELSSGFEPDVYHHPYNRPTVWASVATCSPGYRGRPIEPYRNKATPHYDLPA